MKNPLASYQAICRPESGAGAFFMSILVWGIGIGCFGAAFNNFLFETYDINGFDRGVLEFLRETPGVLLVAIFAALHRFSDWKVLRFGTACSLVAASVKEPGLAKRARPSFYFRRKYSHCVADASSVVSWTVGATAT